MAAVPPGFTIPDFNVPLDVDAVVAPDGFSKGMFLQNVVEQCVAAGRPIPFGPYVAFKDYPAAEHLRLLGTAARTLFPDVSAREGLRRLGQHSYDALSSTFIGKVVFGVLGNNVRAISKLASKGYEISARNILNATVLDGGDDYSLIALEGHTPLVDSYHYGAFEGVLRFCEVQGSVYCKTINDHRVEMFTTWKNKH